MKPLFTFNNPIQKLVANCSGSGTINVSSDMSLVKPDLSDNISYSAAIKAITGVSNIPNDSPFIGRLDIWSNMCRYCPKQIHNWNKSKNSNLKVGNVVFVIHGSVKQTKIFVETFVKYCKNPCRITRKCECRIDSDSKPPLLIFSKHH